MSLIPTSTSANFVIDTNVAIDFLNAPEAAKAKIGAAAVLLVPVAVFSELFHGARKSTRIEDNLKRIEIFASGIDVLTADLETARLYGIIKQKLRTLGTPIPVNDIWIAAAAMQYDAPLITRDKHFQFVPDLQTVFW